MEQTPDIKTNGNRILDLIYKVYGDVVQYRCFR